MNQIHLLNINENSNHKEETSPTVVHNAGGNLEKSLLSHEKDLRSKISNLMQNMNEAGAKMTEFDAVTNNSENEAAPLSKQERDQIVSF